MRFFSFFECVRHSNCQHLRIGTKVDGADAGCILVVLRDSLPSCSVPNANNSIASSRGKSSVRLRKRHAIHRINHFHISNFFTMTFERKLVRLPASCVSERFHSATTFNGSHRIALFIVKEKMFFQNMNKTWLGKTRFLKKEKKTTTTPFHIHLNLIVRKTSN
jgi:hypothetical protein